MLIGRHEEMQRLEELYRSDSFEFLVMYGRWRVGKTTFLQQYANTHKTIFFSAQEKNNSLNLVDFSRAAQIALTGKDFGAFRDWEAAFQYVGDHSGEEKIALIIDEFPFIAQENPTVKSILQHIINHQWSQKNLPDSVRFQCQFHDQRSYGLQESAVWQIDHADGEAITL